MDTLTPQQRSERMSRVRGQNTKPEMRVRRIVHKLGYRYRLHRKDLPGKPDLVFGPKKKVIFVHGCFWHRHDSSSCNLARLPKSRLDFWRTKLDGNKARDARNVRFLKEMGWKVLIVWECESVKNEQLGNRLRKFLEAQ